jgi:hypothetical protein
MQFGQKTIAYFEKIIKPINTFHVPNAELVNVMTCGTHMRIVTADLKGCNVKTSYKRFKFLCRPYTKTSVK